MTAVAIILLMFAQAIPSSLDEIRAEPNPEHRARVAIAFGAAAERGAEVAYSKGDMSGVESALKTMASAIELAQQSLQQTGKSALHHPGPFKFGELRTQDMLTRLSDLDKKMEPDERPVLEAPRAKVQEIHDQWFDSLMSKKK
ncbi:MAG TPA: hypothetical protein VKB79_18065 [Bryobacteraceae bacterium]|nr:hypothetical protein [Bryobacteraceae bacterium]